LVLSLAPSAVYAQAAPPGSPPPPPYQEGTAEFAYVGTSGNSQTQSIGLSGESIVRPDQWTISSKAAYVRNKSAEQLSAESVDLSVKAARALKPRLSAFTRYGFLHDHFAGIDARNIVEAGLSYVLLEAAPQTLTVDGSLGYAHEARVTPPDLSNPTAASDALYKLKPSDSVEVSDDARFSVALSNGEDWRFANIAAVNSKLNSFLSLKFSNTVRYVHAPAAGFQTTDTITAVALVAKF
jgi:putative salt-induced outer membrane protein YdiY